MHTPQIKHLSAQPISQDAFRLYGQVIFACDDHKLFDPTDAQLVLDRGTPRFYIMRLNQRPLRFHRITRHVQCTQCLGALGGKAWFLGVAAPNHQQSVPDLDTLQVFHIPGNCFVKLHLGTWHAGPYFESEWVDFYNLELSDTNVTDHETCDLINLWAIEVEIVTQ